jgi:hypothetical protein
MDLSAVQSHRLRRIRDGGDELLVWSEHLESREFGHLAYAVANTDKLKRLHFSGVLMGRADVRVLVDNALMSPSSLRTLHVVACGITDDGAHAFAKLVQHHPVENLDLSNNNIGDSGCIAVVDAIASKADAKVLFLWLSLNPFGDAGAVALAELLESNDTIQTLGVKKTKITVDGVKRLARAALLAPTVERIFVGDAVHNDAHMDDVLRRPRHAYRKVLAFVSAADLKPVDKKPDHARRFVRACGDMGVIRIIERMLTG